MICFDQFTSVRPGLFANYRTTCRLLLSTYNMEIFVSRIIHLIAQADQICCLRAAVSILVFLDIEFFLFFQGQVYVGKVSSPGCLNQRFTRRLLSLQCGLHIGGRYCHRRESVIRLGNWCYRLGYPWYRESTVFGTSGKKPFEQTPI